MTVPTSCVAPPVRTVAVTFDAQYGWPPTGLLAGTPRNG